MTEAEVEAESDLTLSDFSCHQIQLLESPQPGQYLTYFDSQSVKNLRSLNNEHIIETWGKKSNTVNSIMMCW